jgi:hypothetical protein
LALTSIAGRGSRYLRPRRGAECGGGSEGELGKREPSSRQARRWGACRLGSRGSALRCRRAEEGDDDSAGACVLLFAAACETLYRNDRQMAMPAVMRVGTRHPRARVVVADPVSCCRSKMGSGPMARWSGREPFASSGGLWEFKRHCSLLYFFPFIFSSSLAYLCCI